MAGTVQTAAIDQVLATIATRPGSVAGEPVSVAGQPASPSATTVSVATDPGSQWLAGYRYRGRPLPLAAVPVLRAGPDPAFLTVYRNSVAVGVGRGIVVRGWLGITAVTVAESARRAGVATMLMQSLLQWGRDRGAHSVYLQVDRANPVALAMYEQQGFTEHHGYHYLLAPG